MEGDGAALWREDGTRLNPSDAVDSNPVMFTAVTDYGWPAHQPHPLRETTETIQARQFALEEAVEADEAPTVMLDPRQFIPTQRLIDEAILQGLVGVEFVPAVIVIRWHGKLYIHDGHHRATRALLDGGRVRSAIFDPNEEEAR